MDRHEPELRTPPSRPLPPDEVAQLVEHWVQKFERDANEGVEIAAQERPQRPVTSTGLFTTFTDPIGGSISLSRSDGRLQHRGTVAVRGRCAAVDAACKDLGLPDHVTRAFEFVASWFGFPFDAVNVESARRGVLSWGFWGLSGAELTSCLQQWKRQAPDGFATYLCTFGIDVTDEPGLRVQLDGEVIEGRGAEWSIATEPRLLAALARAGRDSGAQKAQLATVLANWVTSVLSQPWSLADRRDSVTVDGLKSARHVAALLYLARRHGRRAALRLVHRVNERHGPQTGEDAWLAALVRSLRRVNREHDSSEVLRISSSPELTAA